MQPLTKKHHGSKYWDQEYISTLKLWRSIGPKHWNEKMFRSRIEMYWIPEIEEELHRYLN